MLLRHEGSLQAYPETDLARSHFHIHDTGLCLSGVDFTPTVLSLTPVHLIEPSACLPN
jgi:hypothetical protein